MEKVKFLVVLVSVLLATTLLSYGQSDKISPPFPKSPTDRVKPEEALGYPFLDIKVFSASSNSIEYGHEVTLKWTIKGRNIKNLKLELTPDIGVIPLSRTDYSNEAFTIEGSKKIKPLQTQQYTLKVSGIAPGILDPQRGSGPRGLPGVGEKSYADSKSLTVTVKRVILENVKPDVDQKTMKIKFLVKNSGNADFTGPIMLDYKVKSLSGNVLMSGVNFSPNSNIKAGGQVALYEIKLPNRQQALNEDGVIISVSIGADLLPTKGDLLGPSHSKTSTRDMPGSYRFPEVDTDNYEHRWETKRLIINNEMIDTFGGLFTGSIRLNNFDGSKGSVLSHNPYKGNDCYIEIMGRRQDFSLPRFEFSKGKVYDYRGFINNMKASFEGRRFIYIQNGWLNVKIRFETEGTEIKGYEETLGFFHDLTAPDYNFNQFDINVSFYPGLRNGKISYTEVEVFPEVSGDFTGAYELLLREGLENYIDIRISSNLREIIKSLLMIEPVRSRIENKLEEVITRNPLFKIYRLVNVKGEGGNIVIEYIEN